eukprot:5771591-Prymnesium_polylepis.1
MFHLKRSCSLLCVALRACLHRDAPPRRLRPASVARHRDIGSRDHTAACRARGVRAVIHRLQREDTV